MSIDENGDGGRAEAWRRLGEKVDRVGTSLKDLFSRDSVGELRAGLDLEGRTRRNPYGSLAAALGVGFVLGGGLSSRLIKRLLWAGVWRGLQASALPLLEKELAALFAAAAGPDKQRAQGEVP